MTLLPEAQRSFEREKDNPMVQALLCLLGSMYKRVVSWEIHRSPTEISHRVIFLNGDEIRGLIIPTGEDTFIASGTIIPAEYVYMMETEQI